MFIYDKDMERVMMAKKKEVLQEIETAKLRVLKELYCIKRGIHTDMCEMLADYNRIDFNLKKAIKDAEAKLETTVKEFQKIIADALEEHNRTIETKLNELSALQSSVISEVNAALSDLDAMKTTVENLIAQCQELVDNGVTQADLDALRTEIEAALETAGVQSDWNESDETSKAFVKNRTHWIENIVSTSFKFGVKYNGGYDTQRCTELTQSLDDYNYITIDPMRSTLPILNLSKKHGSFLAYTPKGLEFIENGQYFGEVHTNGILGGKSDKDNPLGLFYSPSMGKWIAYNNQQSWQGAFVTVDCGTSVVAKTLDPALVGENCGVERYLVTDGKKAYWEPKPLYEYTKTEIGITRSVTLTKQSDGLTFTSNENFCYPSALVTIGVNTGATRYFITTSLGYGGYMSNISIGVFRITTSSTGIVATIESSDGFEEVETVTFELAQITSKTYSSKYTADDFLIVSPNGNKFKLSVSDDGVLSATAVTE